MRKDHQIITRLTKAGVPRNAWIIKTSDVKRQILKEYASNAANTKDANRLFKPVVFVSGAEDERMLSMELLAKELVFSNIPTKYILYSQLKRLVRHSVNNDVIDQNFHGVGAIVLPDLPYHSEVAQDQETDYLETVGYILSHVYDGGILALSAEDRRSTQVPARKRWPAMVERIIRESGFFCEAINVGRS